MQSARSTLLCCEPATIMLPGCNRQRRTFVVAFVHLSKDSTSSRRSHNVWRLETTHSQTLILADASQAAERDLKVTTRKSVEVPIPYLTCGTNIANKTISGAELRDERM